MATIRYVVFHNVIRRNTLGNIARDRVTSIRPVDCRDLRLRRTDTLARAGAMVVARAGRFRGMRRQGREGGGQGGEGVQALRCLLYTSPSPRDGLLSRM